MRTVSGLNGEEVRRFGRYCSVGLLSVCLNTLIIVGLTRWGRLNYLASVTICFIGVTAVTYVFNRDWTFHGWSGTAAAASLRYGCAAAGQLVLSLVCCYLAVKLMHLRYELIAVFLSAVFAPVGYLVHRRWSFR